MPVPEREYFKDFLRYYIATYGGLLRDPETGSRRKSPVSIGRALAKVRCCVVFFGRLVFFVIRIDGVLAFREPGLNGNRR
jgi:hypothetical protein